MSTLAHARSFDLVSAAAPATADNPAISAHPVEAVQYPRNAGRVQIAASLHNIPQAIQGDENERLVWRTQASFAETRSPRLLAYSTRQIYGSEPPRNSSGSLELFLIELEAEEW
ncbi:hypothetical protein BKA70DRAFT_1434843 [Coprinopsis sp. MPI-PUGE-AT-0042]|nr:hypothetical protein BKA70DRAFT_1434843 [Coprinopsis sp. MPI-PUGE-AT-0042]